jgi:hypothetical protein
MWARAEDGTHGCTQVGIRNGSIGAINTYRTGVCDDDQNRMPGGTERGRPVAVRGDGEPNRVRRAWLDEPSESS